MHLYLSSAGYHLSVIGIISGTWDIVQAKGSVTPLQMFHRCKLVHLQHRTSVLRPPTRWFFFHSGYREGYVAAQVWNAGGKNNGGLYWKGEAENNDLTCTFTVRVGRLVKVVQETSHRLHYVFSFSRVQKKTALISQKRLITPVGMRRF